MGRWDCRLEVITHGFMGYKKGEIDRKAFEKQLDDLGREGFELIHVWPDQKMHGEKDGHLMIRKRYLNEG